jgi:predicted enzyme related to lactoylglutathione lyase
VEIETDDVASAVSVYEDVFGLKMLKGARGRRGAR